MRFHEEFNRCDCGHAYLKKDVYVLASYSKDSADRVRDFKELPEKSEIRYTCAKCNTLIFSTRE
jgi:hypothetical protein